MLVLLLCRYQWLWVFPADVEVNQQLAHCAMHMTGGPNTDAYSKQALVAIVHKVGF